MDVDAIIAGLSEAVRRGVLRFRQNHDGNLWHYPASRDGGAMRRELERLGLCSPKGIATKKGLAVRARLLEEGK